MLPPLYIGIFTVNNVIRMTINDTINAPSVVYRYIYIKRQLMLPQLRLQ